MVSWAVRITRFARRALLVGCAYYGFFIPLTGLVLRFYVGEDQWSDIMASLIYLMPVDVHLAHPPLSAPLIAHHLISVFQMSLSFFSFAAAYFTINHQSRIIRSLSVLVFCVIAFTAALDFGVEEWVLSSSNTGVMLGALAAVLWSFDELRVGSRSDNRAAIVQHSKADPHAPGDRGHLR